MSDWGMVHWSQARQITDLLGLKGKAAPQAGVKPAAYFADLLLAERGTDAITFLAMALPRYEVIKWAADVMARFGNPDRDLDDMRAFEVARQWLRNPSETLRRQCYDLADAMPDHNPEKLLLLAIFMSGGSIAPDGLAPIHPREDITGRLAGGAVTLTVFAAPEIATAQNEALAMGETLARRTDA